MGKLHIIISYDLDKDLGKANNDLFRMIPDEDSILLLDYDCHLLTPDSFRIINEYHKTYPDKILTCFTNRIGLLSKDQLYQGRRSNVSDILYHQRIAKKLELKPISITPITCGSFGGFFLLMSKETWKKYPFKEGFGILGTDTRFYDDVTSAGEYIYRMDSIYVYHHYRLDKDVTDTSHLSS